MTPVLPRPTRNCLAFLFLTAAVLRPAFSFFPNLPAAPLRRTTLSMSVEDEIRNWAADAGHAVAKISPVGSSDWASFRRVETSDPATKFFVKSSSRSAAAMFDGEAMGLRALRVSAGDDGLRIPAVLHCADYEGGKGSLLIMEYLTLGGRGDDRALGAAMARLHLAPPSAEAGNPTGAFGFGVDNTIGGTSQPNPWTKGGGTEEWVKFYGEHRIGHQLQLAGDGRCDALWEDVAPRLGALFEGVEVRPSLLHGDLWSGNIGSADGKPSIFDPAVYWGHHEAEWGMSWCAGLTASFWDGYRSLIPEDEGFLDRKPLYDAYHMLNHYNLFGGGYLGSARGHLENVKRKLDAMGA
mmetsp:Transcript_10206/g.22642  ORF Transcript_10206/g.22642 Transcript_10206/m.22642 type:complete len:352 (-) Transcript_10206:177-1232(-)